MDRFGLHVRSQGLTTEKDRLEAYNRTVAFRADANQFRRQFADTTRSLCAEIQAARVLLPEVQIDPDAQMLGTALVSELGIVSLRAEQMLFETARANAAADSRKTATCGDIDQAAVPALNHRIPGSSDETWSQRKAEEVIRSILATLRKN